MWSECYDFQYQSLNVFPNGDDGLSTAAQATGILISLLVQNLLAEFESLGYLLSFIFDC
jgi:hypothetical protein